MNEIKEWIMKHKIIVVVMSILTIWIINEKCLWYYIDAFVTVGTLFGVWYNYNQNKKQLEPVKIFIKKGSVQKEIPTYIVRKHFTRADVKGILSELHDSDKFYKINYITKPAFLKAILDIQQGAKSELTINIRNDDFFEYEI